MAICPFATWQPIGYNGGSYTGGPFKIVHHTTETPTLEGAMREFKLKPYASHFLVDDTRIIQLIDTDVAARALQNLPGGVQTNRDSAVQIELVAYAARPKSLPGLDNVRKLCRWIEKTHGVPKVWPNGYPKPSRDGVHDPGGHNRNAQNWDTFGGHYGHSQVAENLHWDPGYTEREVEFLMSETVPHEYTDPGQVYTVRAGDTLTRISKAFGVTIGDIVGLNALKNPDDIIVGQILQIRKD